MKLRNDKIIVFGGGSGIGKAVAKRLTDSGVKVLITGRSEEKLRSSAEEINSKSLFYKVFDITDIDGHKALFEYAENSLGALNGFVNAAGICSDCFKRGYEPWDITEQEWDIVTDTDLKAAFFLMRNEVDYMLKKGIRGNILNFASNAACIMDDKIEGMSLTAVCDISDSKLNAFSKNHPDIKCYKNYEELFRAKICDSVIIAVPHPLHAEIAIKAFRYGLNVMLEKPADIAVSKVKKLNAAAKESGKVFAIMFNQRTNPLFAKAREIVKSGQLGELKRTVWEITNWFRTQSYYDSGNWRATWSGEGGGVLLNQAPHNLDLWQWICGMPKSVVAFCDIAKYHNIEVEDDATIFTRYENGATGVFVTSTGEYPGTNRLEISGELGKIVLENGVLKWYKLKTPINKIISESEQGFAQADCDYEEIKQDKPETAHKGILQNFANAILFGEKLISPGVEGTNELTLSNAAYLSEWQGNREISLPFDDETFDSILAKKSATSKYTVSDSEEAEGNSYLPRWQVRW